MFYFEIFDGKFAIPFDIKMNCFLK